MGLVELGRPHPDSAISRLNRGLSASGKQTDGAVRLALGIAMVQAYVGRSDAEAAFRADANVTAAFTLTPAAPDTLLRGAAVAGAEALLLAGRTDEALTRLGATPPGTGFAASWHRVTAARAQLTLGQLPAATEPLQPVNRPGWPYREPAIATHLLFALIADRQQRQAPVITALTLAVDPAQPDGIRRPSCCSAGGSAGEIADDLFVSVNTVKAHLRSMYRKLGVESRRDAVERARAFGLL